MPARPKRHILVVDDDVSLLAALAAVLVDTYNVHIATTGEQACAILREHPIAAIVLDVVLGAESGLDLILRFREISKAPILILTGYGSEEMAVRALRAQANDYLRKPMTMPELRAALARLIDQAEQRLKEGARNTQHPPRRPWWRRWNE